MSSQTFKRLYWAKYTLVSLVFGVSIGLMGYSNMKTSSKTTAFETLSDDLQIEEISKENKRIKQRHHIVETSYATRAN